MADLHEIWANMYSLNEDNTNNKSDDGEGLDKVQPKALKKDFRDRKDKDIDNDGDVDDSDEYIDNKRKTVSKAIKKDKKDGEVEVEEDTNLEEAKGPKAFFGNKDGRSYAVQLNNAKGGNEPRNMGWQIDNRSVLSDFKKDAKKTWASAKGKATLPAVKRQLKAVGATEFYASWKQDSSSYKDDSVEILYKTAIKEDTNLDEGFTPEERAIVKNGQISKAILAHIAKGKNTQQATDAVLGKGFYDKMASELYHKLRKKQGIKEDTNLKEENVFAKKGNVKLVKAKDSHGDNVLNVYVKSKLIKGLYFDGNFDGWWAGSKGFRSKEEILKHYSNPSNLKEDTQLDGLDDMVEAKMENSEVLSAAKRLAANGKDAKAKSFGQGLVDFYKKNNSFTPDQVAGLQNIMKNAGFQLAKESLGEMKQAKRKTTVGDEGHMPNAAPNDKRAFREHPIKIDDTDEKGHQDSMKAGSKKAKLAPARRGDNTVREFVEFLDTTSENIQLDEISDKTVDSYRGKAYSSQRKADHKEMSAGGAYMAAYNNDDKEGMKKYGKEMNKHTRTLKKRWKGEDLVKSRDARKRKLANEDTQLDENFEGVETANLIEKSYRKYFPKGMFYSKKLALGGSGFSFTIGLIGDKKDLPNGIEHNDPMRHVFMVNSRDGVFEVTSPSGNLSVNPPEKSFMAMGSVKTKFRKLKGDEKKIVAGMDRFFSKLKNTVKDNKDNIYGADKIRKYIGEGVNEDTQLDENFDDNNVEYKAILSSEGRKIGGLRSGKYHFDIVDKEGYVKNVTYKQFKAHSAKLREPSDHMKKQIIASLMGQEKQFNKKIELNGKLRNVDDFWKKLDILLDTRGISWPKAGLKA